MRCIEIADAFVVTLRLAGEFVPEEPRRADAQHRDVQFA